MPKQIRGNYRRSQLFVAVNNIPTPYRSHLFASLSEALGERGVRFEAWYMARGEYGRYWRFDPTTWNVNSRLYWGAHPRAMGITFHLNPGMLSDLARMRPTWMLLGGSWLTPTTAMLNLTAPYVGRGTRALIWAEANYASSSSNPDGVVNVARRRLYEHAAACVIPGQIAEQTIREIWGIHRPSLIRLPNVVDENQYCAAVMEARKERSTIRSAIGIKANDVAILIMARLHEQSKGILNFLQAIEPALKGKLKILIAGDGPDRANIERWIQNRYTNAAILLGHVEQHETIRLLAACDALALPSFRDPNPLAVVEGLWAGLPLIVSEKCGNWPEAVHEGSNGWVIDPYNHATVLNSVTELADTSPERRRLMGEASRHIAECQFLTSNVVRTFIDSVSRLK